MLLAYKLGIHGDYIIVIKILFLWQYLPNEVKIIILVKLLIKQKT